MNTKIIIKAIPGKRQGYIDYLNHYLPEAEYCWDQCRNHMDTFIRALEQAGDEPCIHMEDDIRLTVGFREKVEQAISERPGELIQFFSMRKKDREIGSRYDNTFLMNQCTYYPAGYSSGAVRFYREEWVGSSHEEKHPTGSDIMIQRFLRSIKSPYWIHCPNLVDHRVGVSEINPKRPRTNRQSFTFCDPVPELVSLGGDE